MRPARTWTTAVIAVLLAVGVLTACGSSDQHPSSTTEGKDSEQTDHNAQDIAYARNMADHHGQAVQMAQMVPTNSTNAQLINLANGITLTLVPEIQAFRAFLMQWQDAEGADTAPRFGLPMAGAIDKGTMDKLGSLTGGEFDRLWLTTMIAHAQGAITMAADEVAHGRNPDVIYLANRVTPTQRAMIDQMKKLLGG